MISGKEPVKRSEKKKVALVLSGGGARGAYEVGVLSYLFGDFARLRRRVPHIDILCGTSVGAINACHLAAHLSDPAAGVPHLAELWRSIELSKILGFGWSRMLSSLPRVLAGGSEEARGLFDVKPISDLVSKQIPWRGIAHTFHRGSLQALSVSATEVSTGRTVIFLQLGPHGALPQTVPPRTIIRAERVGPVHALASAAIPILFPPVRIGTRLYTDGSLRQNTPIAPALRLGATHVITIGLSREQRGMVHPGPLEGNAPSASFLLGKMLNAFLLDHIDSDLELLKRVNSILEDGERAFGSDFSERLNIAARERGGIPYRHVTALAIRPTEDIGKMAADYLRRANLRVTGGGMVRKFLSFLDVGPGNEADLASYLLFDGHFAKRLIDLGRADAEARREQLLDFFEDSLLGSHEELPPPSFDSDTTFPGTESDPLVPVAIGLSAVIVFAFFFTPRATRGKCCQHTNKGS